MKPLYTKASLQEQLNEALASLAQHEKVILSPTISSNRRNACKQQIKAYKQWIPTLKVMIANF